MHDNNNDNDTDNDDKNDDLIHLLVSMHIPASQDKCLIADESVIARL